MTNNTLILQMVAELNNLPLIYSSIELTSQANSAINSIVARLDSLPSNHPVLQFIHCNAHLAAEVMSYYKNGAVWPSSVPQLFYPGYQPDTVSLSSPLVPPRPSGPRRGYPFPGTSPLHYEGKGTGVYIWSEITGQFQYVGSTINFVQRMTAQWQDFLTGSGTSAMYQWACVNGGVHELHWYEAFKFFNFYLGYLQANPYCVLNVWELCLLKAVSELLPRIVEQSLLAQFHFKWNKQQTVQFYFTSLRSQAIASFLKGPELVICNAYSGVVLRADVPNPTIAADLLGLRTRAYLVYCVENGISFYSPTFKQTVIVNYKQLLTPPFLRGISIDNNKCNIGL